MTLSVEDLQLSSLDPAGRQAICAALVKRARQQVGAGYAAGVPSPTLLRQLADDFDALVRGLFAGVVPDDAPLSLVALGGYGRRELYPFSDLDLLVLHQGVAESLTTLLVERLIYPLWDAGVSVGYAVRGIEETLDLAATDFTVQTALLDARLLTGDEGPFHALGAGALREFFGPQKVNRFVEQLAEERAARHARFGESVYLLEPNVKRNKGGLRDANTAAWAAKARFDVDRLERLPDVGAATVRQAKGLAEAYEFLRALRLTMHLKSERAQDQLLFELQERIAPEMFPAEEIEIPGVGRRTTSAVAPAVERLMRAFYRHARTVVVESEGVLERCRVPDQKTPPMAIRLDEHLVAVDRLLTSSSPERLWEQPAELVRIFEVALVRGLRLDRAIRDVIAEALAGDPGAQLPADEEAARRFVTLLTYERADRLPPLQEMHDLGLITAVIPELEPCAGRVQHDLYHVYTVDQHLLYVVKFLHALRRGEAEASQRYPQATRVARELQRPAPLYLAALLHDVAKPLGSGHSEKGARLAAGVAARLGLGFDDLQTVTFLVREHLTMAHISQRRDLSDPEVITSFARLVGDAERLRALYLLTVADTAMTRPGNLTEWKAALLDELFLRALRQIEGDGEIVDEQARLAETRRAALTGELASRWGPRGERLVATLPRRLLLSADAAELAEKLELVCQLEQDDAQRLRLGFRRLGSGPITEVTVVCDDAPGLLATIAGVFVTLGIEVLSAQVFNLHPEEQPQGERCPVLDVFQVTQQAADEEQLWGDLQQRLHGALTGSFSLEESIRAHTAALTKLPRRALPPVATRISFDNSDARHYTIVEIDTADRRGLLHAVTRQLSELGLEIHLAMIDTGSGRVVDSFYVQERVGGVKIKGQARLAEIEKALIEAIEELGDAT